MQHYEVFSNDDPELTLTHFRPRSSLSDFLKEKVKTIDFSETTEDST